MRKILLPIFLVACFYVCNAQAPVNDNCANALVLPIGNTCQLNSFNTSTATQSMVECASGSDADDDVWFKFTPADSIVQLTVNGIDAFDPVIEVLTACNGISMNCIDKNGQGITEILVDTFIIGQTYYVRIYDYSSISTNNTDFSICAFYPKPPVNDDCAAAITVVVDSVPCQNPTSATLYFATASTPTVSCSGTAEDDVWFQFVANASNVTVKVNGNSGLNPVIELHSSCGNSLLACSDSLIYPMEYINASNLTINNTYYVRVFDFDSVSTTSPDFEICIFKTPPPPVNDNCNNAITLVQDSVCTPSTFNNFGATHSGIGNECSGTADDDMWFKFVATTQFAAVHVNPSSGYDPIIEFFNSCTDTIANKCISSIPGEDITLTWSNLIVGNQYYIRVYDYGNNPSTTNSFDICVYSIPTPPSNDECNGSIQIFPVANKQACLFGDTATTVNATPSFPNQPVSCVFSNDNDDDIWYYFIAQDSSITVNAIPISGGTHGIGMLLYAGSCNGFEMNECTSNADGDSLTFTDLTIGSFYYLRLFTTGSDTTGVYAICAHYNPTLGVSINENELGSTVQLFPNPANNLLQVTIKTSNQEKAKIDISNTLGQIVKQIELNTKNETTSTIDISELNSGMYYFTLESEKLRKTMRFIKN
ncbi:MAG: T9SS type A sorting domain-containing protein [Bacteroidetes bacterium]|nr:T9SS type A sorting domain-containing protein [Bacteroidota bacterium]